MQPQPLSRETSYRLIQQVHGKVQFGLRFQPLAQGAAHEAAILTGGAKDHLRQDRFVELHQRRAGRQQEVQFFAKHTHNISGQIFARPIWRVGETVQPHGASQQVGPRQGHLDRLAGRGPGELQFPGRQRLAPANLSENHGMPDFRGGYIEGPEFRFELVRVVHHRRQVAQWNELAVVQQAAHEAGIAVSSLFPVGQNIDARA